MANWATLKEAIASVIKTNGNQEITGVILQNTLNSIVNSIGENATFAGIAIPTTNPGTPDGPVFYLATQEGEYANFNGITVLTGEAVILQWNNGSWSKKTSGFAIQQQFAELEKKGSVLFDAPSSLKNYVKDIQITDTTYQSYSIRVREITDTFIVLYLYGLSDSAINYIGRGDISCSLVGLQAVNFSYGNGAFLIDANYTDDVINDKSIVTAKPSPYYSVTPYLDKLGRNFDLYDMEKNVNEFTDWKKAQSQILKEDTTSPQSIINKIQEGFSSLNVLYKKNVSKVGFIRLYASGLHYNCSLAYYDENGDIKIVGYDANKPVAEDTQDLIIEDENIAFMAHIDWTKVSTVLGSGSYDYNAFGINDKYIIPYTLLYAEKNFFNGGVISDVVVCGYDADKNVKIVCSALANIGMGYVCKSTDTDIDVNAFIDTLINKKVTIHFYGTIRTSVGIHKHPKHNLDGYNCTLKMGDNLDSSYESCIRPTTGGVPFSSQQVVSHNYTFVKGFTLDGNATNNTTTNSVYGAVICGELYNIQTFPYNETQLISNIILEDINAIDTMRGVIVGIGWHCRNLKIGTAKTDHALYLAGADRAIVENVYIYGEHRNGAVSISGQSWDTTRQVKGIILKNVYLDEVLSTNGAMLDIRGHFSNWGNNKTLRDVLIDGFFIKKEKFNWTNSCVMIGTYHDAQITSPMTRADVPYNITIRNFVADIQLRNSLFRIYNANVNLEDAAISLLDYRDDRPLFQIQSNSVIKGGLTLNKMRIAFDGTTYTTPYCIFGFDNTSQSYNVVNGLDISDLVIDGDVPYYIFGRAESSVTTTSVSLLNVNQDRVIAEPIALVNPSDADYIKIE